MKIVIFHENPDFNNISSVLEFKESNPPNQTNEPTKKESSRKKKNRIKMSRKFPFMKSIEDVSKIDNLNGSHSTSLNQYKVSKTEFPKRPGTFFGSGPGCEVCDLGKSYDPDSDRSHEIYGDRGVLDFSPEVYGMYTIITGYFHGR